MTVFPSGRASLAVAIAALNALAHFLPPERASVAPDDYANLAMIRKAGREASRREAMADRERPLNRLFVVWQAGAVGTDHRRAFVLLLASSTIVSLAGLAFLTALLPARPALAFLASVLYVLMPWTVETHHAAIFANINLAIALYALAAAAFLRHLRRPNRWLRVAALLGYTAGVVWYEVGFFMPVLLWAAARAWAPERQRECLPFLVIAVSAAAYRLTDAAPGPFHHAVGLNLRPLVTLFHQYLGLLLLRTLAYGAYCFTRLPPPWLVAAAAMDALAVAFVLRALAARSAVEAAPADAPRLATTTRLACVAFIVFLAPMFLQARGGIAGRHLALPSLGLSLVAAVVLVRRRRAVLAAVLTLGLLVAQGNAWAQVEASRLNRALFDVIQARAPELARADRVVIDLRSFVDAIPSTWVPVPFDLLNTYYGAQAFEEWGIEGMVRVAAGEVPVHFAVDRPRSHRDGRLVFQEGTHLGSRAFSARARTVPVQGSVVIGYADVNPPLPRR